MTRTAIVLAVLALIVYDIVVVICCEPAYTLSATVYEVARDHPIISFALGIVIGHILWPNGGKP